MVYAGDMTIAAPGIAVSTFDLLSIKNALQTLFAHHYHHSSRPGRIALPYAGPPMGCKDHEFSDTYNLHALLGVYQYMLYSGDFAFLTEIWKLHVYALQFTLDKINPATGLLVVTSPGDWLRPGMGGETSRRNRSSTWRSSTASRSRPGCNTAASQTQISRSSSCTGPAISQPYPPALRRQATSSHAITRSSATTRAQRSTLRTATHLQYGPGSSKLPRRCRR